MKLFSFSFIYIYIYIYIYKPFRTPLILILLVTLSKHFSIRMKNILKKLIKIFLYYLPLTNFGLLNVKKKYFEVLK